MSFVAALLLCLGDPAALPPERPVASAVVAQEGSPVPSYAERERAATDLEQFRGGSEGLLILIVVVVAVLVLVAIILPW